MLFINIIKYFYYLDIVHSLFPLFLVKIVKYIIYNKIIYIIEKKKRRFKVLNESIRDAKERVVRRGCVTRRKDPFRVQPDTEVWKWISRLVASGSACYGVGHGYRAGSQPVAHQRSRASEDEDALARAWLVWGRCGSFTGNRVSHAPFFVTKRKAAAGRMAGERLAKSDWSCVGLPSFSATQ